MSPATPISYVTTDFEFESRDSLDQIVAELEPQAAINYHSSAGPHEASFGIGVQGDPEREVEHICELIEALSPLARAQWARCSRRMLDVAVESGTEPNSETFTLSPTLVARASALGFGVAVTVYRVGAYSDDDSSVR